MKLLGSTKSKLTKNENDENVPYLEITEVVHCNIVKNDYQHYSRVLQFFGQLLDISPRKKLFLAINVEFLHIEVWFTD